MFRRILKYASPLFMLLLALLPKLVSAQTPTDTLAWPLNENNAGSGGVYMDPPDSYTEEVTFDPATNTYLIVYKMGNVEVGRENKTFEEYTAYRERQVREDYWRKKEQDRVNGSESNSLIPAIKLDALKGIFGSNKVEIRPQGTVELIMGGIFNSNQNPSIPIKQRRTANFDFKQNIQLNVVGKIGDKININTNFNTQEMFNFKNKLNLKYEGQEDDILKLIELGNVSMTLPGSLITGMQSLFGGKIQLQFGRLKVTGLFSQQRGTREEVNVAGGAQIQKFEISAADYELNKHYFLGEYFKQQYDNALRNLPLINSNVRITRIEVWVTNKVNAVQNVRNLVGILPLGETVWPINTVSGAGYPDNGNLPYYSPSSWTQNDRTNVSSAKFKSLDGGTEIEYLNNARLLNPNEFTYNELLGYVSLNQPLNNDEVLAVAYQYTGADGILHQVGEFSTDVQAPDALMLKLLKSTTLNVHKPNWDWMMKNIYNIGGYGISREKFVMNILYRDVEKGTLINIIPDAALPDGVKQTPLLKVFNLDRLNPNNDQQPDGFFDYIENITMQSQNGRIIFPVREPFGGFIRSKINNSAVLADKYAFDSLYTTIQPLAKLYTERNRFYLAGEYQSSVSSEIQLNAINIEPGSVTVTAGGQVLQENVDYTVDYTLGRVKIINTGLLTSGTAIKVSMETNQLFNQQTKRIAGGRLDYTISKNFLVGATLMNLNERPFTQKVNIGEEPISNTIVGFDLSYNKELPWLTRLIDRIPGISTKAPSRVNIFGEFAYIIPGYNKVIGKPGYSQIDDFEGAESVINYQIYSQWRIGTVPHKQTNRFPFAEKFNDLRSGFGRGLMTWYNMDPIFFRQNAGTTPEAIYNDKNSRSNNYVREIRQVELFPNLQLPPGQQPNLNVFDVAFFPTTRGPYNLDFNSLDANGKISDPRKSFGSIMRRSETTDWDGANIDYIEFWLMDPFDKDLDQLKEWETGTTGAQNANRFADGGGDLLIQIGNMTEDLLQDGKFFFENGMPTATNGLTDVQTVWGRVPGEQVINQAFSNGADERRYQDIGYDGLSSDQTLPGADPQYFEQNFYATLLNNLPGSLTQDARNAILADPSADNFRPYVGDMYTNGGSTPVAGSYIHERYKKFQNPEGNSPEGNITASNSQYPNSEDINNDNTLNQTENYFQYRVSIRKNDFQTGTNYITDSIRVSVSAPNGVAKQVTWYQFRVPVRGENKEAFGNISDWRSIRFIRMVAQGFPDDIYFRFGKFELVRADWRRFPAELNDPVPFVPSSQNTDFNVFTVNIEENSQKQPFNYVLPQGITREIDPSNPALQQLNEQSLVLDVCNLPDGVAKAVYKTSNLDLRAYKNLEMFVHAEDKQGTLMNGDVTVFVRIGTDPSDNYYEYELPVSLSVSGDQSINNIWPPENKMMIPLQDLPEVKRERNQMNFSISELYSIVNADGHRITVKGNPNLRDVKSILIGVRNPHESLNPFNTNDNSAPVCVQVWVNELRVSDYFEKGGWAANVRMQTQLADLGTFNVAASHETFGFGAIDKRPLQRARNNTTTFDLSTNLELAKFTPQKWGLSIPLFVGYNYSIARPQFNPIDPDVKLKDALKDLGTDSQRDSLRSVSNTLMQRRAINLTNVRKNRTNSKRKPMPWDIENFDGTYAWQDQKMSSSQYEYDKTFSHRGSLGYNYAPTMKYWEPFRKSKHLKSKWAKLIKEFNFTLLPKQFTFRTDLYREFNEMKFRNNTDYDLLIEPTYRKNFTWDRTYNFSYAPFKALNITFNAINNGRVDEPEGKIDTKAKRDSMNKNLSRLARTIHYTQNLNVTYNIPFSKFPMTDWITTNVGYSASFDYQSGQLLKNSVTGKLEKPWGNTISNSNNINIQGQLNFTTLYNKVPYFKSLNSPSSKTSTAPKTKPGEPTKENPKKPADEPKVKIVNFEGANFNFRKDKSRMIKHKLKTEKVTVKVFDEEGKEVKGKVEVFDKNRVKFTPNRDAKKATVKIEGKIEKKTINVGKEIGRFLAGILTSVKNVSVTYTQSNGTTLPGYINNSNMLGQDFRTGSPGFGFIFGEQFSGIGLARKAGDNNWLTKDTTLNSFFMRSRNSNLNISATVEPIKSLRVQLTATRQFTQGEQSLFRFDPSTNDYRALSTLQTGNYSVSYMSIATAFSDAGGKSAQSALFAKMLAYRQELSGRFGNANPYSANLPTTDPGYRGGYGRNQQDVLMYSFLAAYSGRSPSDISTKIFPSIPAVNWNITYDGLRNIGIFKKLLRNFVVSHGYRSTYSIAGFMNNQKYRETDAVPGFTDVLDTNKNFVSKYILQNVSIIEAFSPLINFDMTWKNSLTTKFEVKKSRNVGMNFQNNQLTENSTMEYIIGIGYKIEKLRLPIIIGGKPPEGSLSIRLDIGVRDNKTAVRKVPDASQPTAQETVTAGQQNITVKFFVDYGLSKSINVRLFFDHLRNNPFVANQFKTSNTNAGISLRFTLAP